ncbi:DJ-1/PfpI family protein [Sulfitobacter sp. M57]|uniref:DJ-1/PfpI family protein n=1 Tax=unclassified Sulfitobacter TaxID=196795 RepID=UPI0023E184A7|nr:MULTISPECIES: DJ-1/PfpI family protein [unclassified Sulfitobacter]MDF3415427.1 DJ-1/PfpI family protein [Sulfitobacter sp. KE5]MDF3422908.1 DJ-1/PfpI family protein [Sulfitobacter sp. KE43]MDF3433973.1 DJ-1/PfpI family protein [Sulfitobacter sp. KE42]MDF3459613.1 DJ-1/PfpI family protein [Sulfitobacter sp. S74]MDF3463512.1 DJ-1/PfpI family protein [Sulfitobacter sp. Ks18]
MQIALVLYPGFTALDVLGPYEVLKMLPGVDLRFVAHEVGPVVTDRGILVVAATHTFDETPAPDMVLVPGSEAQTAIAAADGTLTKWLRQAHVGTRFTTSVCSGAVVLGAAGLLKGLPATTHWAAMDVLNRFGAIPQPDKRVVTSGNIWTAAGVSAGIDLAFSLVEVIAGRETAERIQLIIEYDPQPPQDAGHMSKATADVAETARAEMAKLSRNPMNAVALSKLVWRKAISKARKAHG